MSALFPRSTRSTPRIRVEARGSGERYEGDTAAEIFLAMKRSGGSTWIADQSFAAWFSGLVVSFRSRHPGVDVADRPRSLLAAMIEAKELYDLPPLVVSPRKK